MELLTSSPLPIPTVLGNVNGNDAIIVSTQSAEWFTLDQDQNFTQANDMLMTSFPTFMNGTYSHESKQINLLQVHKAPRRRGGEAYSGKWYSQDSIPVFGRCCMDPCKVNGKSFSQAVSLKAKEQLALLTPSNYPSVHFWDCKDWDKYLELPEGQTSKQGMMGYLEDRDGSPPSCKTAKAVCKTHLQSSATLAVAASKAQDILSLPLLDTSQESLLSSRANEMHKSTKGSGKMKMHPGLTKNGCNLCAHHWHKQVQSGRSTEEFQQYYNGLSAEQQKIMQAYDDEATALTTSNNWDTKNICNRTLH
ncbi:hypothetical protein EDD16DRAFT_1524376 [Pisolithus croceorrhizus]|nr:hypothetical protein EV401DRAFT_1896356 [Pisolithus croceorrhizus]KAI6105146.1 hypothetical protein EDD16DRAFT_1524376 [Pisolithus croceorrhizus]KAI6165475.1 hypothetical protein EDD17DRAFT_1505929 [Pisolithus thermaeus]